MVSALPIILALTAMPAISAPSLPLMAPGGNLSAAGKPDRLTSNFRIPTPGVWYLWVRVSNKGGGPAEMSYGLDGVPVKAPRGIIPVPAGVKSTWLSQTAHEKFIAEVHADKPGKHRLELRATRGEITVEKVALTLAYLAKPTDDNESLDHSRDPGKGRAYFPVTDTAGDGFLENRPVEELKFERAFYLDNEQGNDGADGLSPRKAWKTPARANKEAFSPGDALLLKRGCAFTGGLAPMGGGAPGRPVAIGAWGKGPRPVIDGGKSDAINIAGTSHWVIRDLELTSDMNVERSGLKIATLAGGEKHRGESRPTDITVINVVSHDNGRFGILVGSEHGEGNGYENVRIENCLVYCNKEDGIKAGGTTARGARNIVIRNCTAHSNMSLAGIWIQSAQNGLIERCKSYNNFCYNIWVWNAINVTIRHCEVWRGIGPNLSGDEGGYDIDWSCHACTIEYCYSHHNNGMGYLLMGLGDGEYAGTPQQSRYNIVRYCVSIDDNPGVWNVETWEFGMVYNCLFATSRPETNAVGVTGWPLNPVGENSDGGWPADSSYLNNIIASEGDSPPLNVSDYAARQRNIFDGNLYHHYGQSVPLIVWGGRKYALRTWNTKGVKEEPQARYQSVTEFTGATGQETHGKEANPGLDNIFLGEYGRLPLDSLRLPANSPAVGAVEQVKLSPEWLAGRAKILEDTGAEKMGIPMTLSPATQDYWGNPLKPGEKVSIGPGEPRR